MKPLNQKGGQRNATAPILCCFFCKPTLGGWQVFSPTPDIMQFIVCFDMNERNHQVLKSSSSVHVRGPFEVFAGWDIAEISGGRVTRPSFSSIIINSLFANVSPSRKDKISTLRFLHWSIIFYLYCFINRNFGVSTAARWDEFYWYYCFVVFSYLSLMPSYRRGDGPVVLVPWFPNGCRGHRCPGYPIPCCFGRQSRDGSINRLKILSLRIPSKSISPRRIMAFGILH